MKNHKLFSVIAQLNRSEKRDLAKFLQSPLYNNRKLALQLYQFLEKQAPNIPDKTTLFNTLFPKETYKDEKIRLCMSQLVKKIEAFLIYQYQQQQILQNSKVLAQVYQEKNLPKIADQVLQKTLKTHKKTPIRNGLYYFEQYDLNLKQFDFATSKRTKTQNLPVVSDSLDTAFLILKLQQACSSLSYQAVNQQEHQMGLLTIILPYIEANNLFKIPAIGIYYHCFLALNGEEVSNNFNYFKQLLFEHRVKFPKVEWSNLFLFGTNICIKLINQGKLAYLKEILELYKEGLTTKALLNKGILTRFTYQNITTSAIRSGDLVWTRQFLIDYKDKVEKNYRESAFRFNMARLAYVEKNYNEAIDLLRDTDQGDLLINLYSKNLLLKIYYEIGEYKLLDSFLDAFQIYLRRKKEIASHRKNYWNMIYYTQKLMKVNPFNKEAIRKLKTRMEEEEILLERKWLVEQLDKL